MDTTQATAGYVIQQPHSSTNPTDKYRVVSYSAWLEAADSDGPTNLSAVSEHDDHASALAARNELNRQPIPLAHPMDADPFAGLPDNGVDPTY